MGLPGGVTHEGDHSYTYLNALRGLRSSAVTVSGGDEQSFTGDSHRQLLSNCT